MGILNLGIFSVASRNSRSPNGGGLRDCTRDWGGKKPKRLLTQAGNARDNKHTAPGASLLILVVPSLTFHSTISSPHRSPGLCPGSSPSCRGSIPPICAFTSFVGTSCFSSQVKGCLVLPGERSCCSALFVQEYCLSAGIQVAEAQGTVSGLSTDYTIISALLHGEVPPHNKNALSVPKKVEPYHTTNTYWESSFGVCYCRATVMYLSTEYVFCDSCASIILRQLHAQRMFRTARLFRFPRQSRDCHFNTEPPGKGCSGISAVRILALGVSAGTRSSQGTRRYCLGTL